MRIANARFSDDDWVMPGSAIVLFKARDSTELVAQTWKPALRFWHPRGCEICGLAVSERLNPENVRESLECIDPTFRDSPREPAKEWNISVLKPDR